MVDKILKLVEQYIDSGKFIFLIFGVIGFFLKIIAKYIQKKLNEVEALKNEVKGLTNKIEIYDLKAEGRAGFVTTVMDLNQRVGVLEKIIERRKDNVIVIEDRRKRYENFSK